MNERFPIEIALIAFEGDRIEGWMGLERVTGQIGEVGRWQPFVMDGEGKEQVAKHLISNLTDYAKMNDMGRIEVGFGSISEDNLDTYKSRCLWYESEGWKKVEDSNFMVSDLTERKLDEIKLPSGYDLHILSEFENDSIFECYYSAFTTGDARWIYDMTQEQLREEFEKNFDRSRNINKDASFVILADGVIIGFILVISRPEEEEHLESIGIHPKFRGLGLGKILLNRSTKVLQKQDIQNFTLGVDTLNTPAIKLYEQFGFEAVSRTARYSRKT